MNQGKWVLHPLVILIFSILALGTSLFLYIYWYVGAKSRLLQVVDRLQLNRNQVISPDAWVVILVLSLLVGIILVGISVIFVYNHKTFQLYQMQYNFINNFTHELKTPVTSLKLYLETMEKHALSRPDQLKYFQYMLKDVDRLSDTVNRILNLARIESKGDVGKFENTELVAAIERFVTANRHFFNDAEITVDAPAGAAYNCTVNPGLFDILLMNLITNAIKYNNSSPPRMGIRFEQNRRFVRIYFEDNGIGFSKKESRKIFKKFYQIGKPDNMTAKGSGLGLHLVQLIARLHKGKIMAHSRGRGQGAVFILHLPCRARTQTISG